jgi:hypothetical protein
VETTDVVANVALVTIVVASVLVAKNVVSNFKLI